MARLLLTFLLLNSVYIFKANDCHEDFKKLREGMVEIAAGVSPMREHSRHRTRRDVTERLNISEKLAETLNKVKKRPAANTYDDKSNFEFRKKLLRQYYEMRKQGQFVRSNILANKMNKTIDFQQKYLEFQKMLIEAGKKRQNLTLGPEYRIYFDHRQNITEYMKKLKEEGVSKETLAVKVADKMYEYWFNHVNSLRRNRRDTNQQNPTIRLPFREKMLEKIKHLSDHEFDILGARINRTTKLQDKFFEFQKMIEDGKTDDPEFEKQNKTYFDLTRRCEIYMNALRAKGFPENVIEDKVADKINEYWFNKAELKSRNRRDVNTQNHTIRLSFRDKMLARIQNLRDREFDKLAARFNRTAKLQELFFAFQKMVDEGNTLGPEFDRHNETCSDLTEICKKYMTGLREKGFPEDVIEDKVADKMNEYWFNKTQLKRRKKRDVIKRNRTLPDPGDSLIEHIKNLSRQGRFEEIKKLYVKVMKVYKFQEKFLDFQKTLAELSRRGVNMTVGTKLKRNIDRTKTIIEYMKSLENSTGFLEQVKEKEDGKPMKKSLHRTMRDTNKQNQTVFEFRDKIIEQMKNLSAQGNIYALEKLSTKVMKSYEMQEKYLTFQNRILQGSTEGPEFERQNENYDDLTGKIQKYNEDLQAQGLPNEIIQDKVIDKTNEYWFNRLESKQRARRDVNKQNNIRLEFRDKLEKLVKNLSIHRKTNELEKLSAIVTKTYALREKYFDYQNKILEGRTEGPEFQTQNEAYDDLTDRIERHVNELRAQGFPENIIEEQVGDTINAYWFRWVESNMENQTEQTKRIKEEQNEILQFRYNVGEKMKKLRREGKIDELKKIFAIVNKTRELQNKYLAFQNMLVDAEKKGENVIQGPDYKIQMQHTKNREKHLNTLKINFTGLPEHIRDAIIADKMYEYWFKHAESLLRTRRDTNKQNRTALEFNFRDKLVEHMKNLSNQGKTDELKKLSAIIVKTRKLQDKYLAFQNMAADAEKKGETVTQGPDYKIQMEHTKNLVAQIETLQPLLTGLPQKEKEEKVADKMYEYWFKHVESLHRTKRDANEQNETVFKFRYKLAERIKNLRQQGNSYEMMKLLAIVNETHDLQEECLAFQLMLADADKKGKNVTKGPNYKRQMEHTKNLVKLIKSLQPNLTGLPQNVSDMIVVDKMYEYCFKHVESLHRPRRDANEQNYTGFTFKDKIVKQVKELESQKNFTQLNLLLARIKKAHELQGKYVEFEKMLTDEGKRKENITRGLEFKRNMEHTWKILECIRDIKGFPEHEMEDRVQDRMNEYWFNIAKSMVRKRRDINEQNHTVLEFKENLTQTMKKLRNQGNVDELKKMSAKIKKSFELQEKYLDYQKFLTNKIKNGERSQILKGPDYKWNMEHTRKIVEYMRHLKQKGFYDKLTQDKIADKMNEYWYKHVEEEFFSNKNGTQR